VRKKFQNKFHWTDLVTYLFFVLLAACVWYGHAMHSVRNTRVPVLVNYTGLPGTIAIGSEGLPDTVQVEVRDAGQRLNAYLQDPPHLTVDLRSYVHGEKGTIHITADDLRRKISDLLQGTSRLISTTPEEISCTYYTEREKTVRIVSDVQLTMANEYQMVGEPQLSQTSIKIFGNGAQLETIDSIYTERREIGDLSDTTTIRVALAPPVGVRVEKDSIELLVIAERFTEKKITLPLRAENVPAGYTIRLFPREVEATLRVGMSHFGQVSDQDVVAVCHYSAERKDKLDVQLRYTNPYITDAWVYPATVEFILEQ
jgi:hypothetical protein